MASLTADTALAPAIERFRGLEAVGFDLDFTLWDADDFARTFFEEIAGEFGRRLGRSRRQVALALHGSLDRLTLAEPRLFDHALHRLGAWDPRLVAELVGRYHRHRPPARPYPGAEAALGRLRAAGFRLFLVTDGDGDAQRHKVAALGLGPWFDELVFTGDWAEPQRKPSPFPFQLACGRLGLAPARCAYVGDNPDCDVQGPRALGMLTVGVATGPYAARAAGSGPAPDLRIGGLEQLGAWLDQSAAAGAGGRT
jgi:putative hydrolase of the HAD superfamily